MDPRYSKNPEIRRIWSTENKLRLWQVTELAVIDARARFGEISAQDTQSIRVTLKTTPIDIDWWKKRDAEISHDLIAFVEERRRHLPERLQRHLHEKLTSYDTEEPAFAIMLHESVTEVERMLGEFVKVLVTLIERHRFTVMLGETHGQGAELQTFGKRVATWLAPMLANVEQLRFAKQNLLYSKLSGAVGNSADISSEIQKEALAVLGFEPFYGATQIMPRELYAPLASALGVIMATLAKIATDARLGARSSRVLMREPFGKSQKGSSRMPQKRNTITWEQMVGILRLVKSYVGAIQQNIQTWNERGIEQSCVERVAWPDLFFCVTHALSRMTNTLRGLEVYPDEMLREIIDCRDVYAASKAVDFLNDHGQKYGIQPEDAYRIVQLAAWNVFEPGTFIEAVRQTPFKSYGHAQATCVGIRAHHEAKGAIRQLGIKSWIRNSALRVSPDLAADEAKVAKWNQALKSMFSQGDATILWDEIFSFEHNLRGEATQIDGVLSKVKIMFGEQTTETQPQT